MRLNSAASIQDVTYQRASFAHHEPASALPVIDRLRDIPVKTLVRTEVSPQGLDAYVIVTKASSRYGSRGHTVSGLGAVDDRTVMAHYAAGHALYTIWVIDGRSYEVIDQEIGVSARQRGDHSAERSKPYDRSSALLSRTDLAASEQIRVALSDLLMKEKSQGTLRDLRLVGRP